MSSFLSASLLAQSQQSVQTRQALIVLGLQNDFVSPDGKLPVSNASGYLDHIKELIPAFREHGIIIWVRSEYREDRVVNEINGCMVVVGDSTSNDSGPTRDQAYDPRATSGSPPRRSYRSSRRVDDVLQRVLSRVAEQGDEGSTSSPLPAPSDDELFLSRTEDKEPCCLPGTIGAEYAPEIAELMQPQDLHITKSYYSAFSGTNLLFYLHTRIITEVYFVGCNTNLSVYATAADAARHGIQMNVVEDCLGYRHRDRHDQAIRQLVSGMGAYTTTASSVLARVRGEQDTAGLIEEEGSDADDSEADTELVRERFRLDRISGDFQDLMLSDDPPLTAVDSFPSVPTAEHTEHAITQSADTDIPAVERFQHTSKRPREQDSQDDGNVEQRLDQSAPSENTSLFQGVDREAQTLPTMPTEEQQITSFGERTNTVNNETQNQATVPEQPLPSIEEPPPSTEQPPQIPSPLLPTIEHPTAHIERETTQVVIPSQPLDTDMPTSWQSTPWRSRKRNHQQIKQALGPNDTIGSGDTHIVLDLLPPSRSDTMFLQLLQEVHWQKMYHVAGEVPRLVCCQGDINPSDGSMPVYRHPSDSSLPLLHWSRGVTSVRKAAEAKVGHKLNHVLIQLYRTGQDHISEHTDKTLDIVSGSKIANVSFGAERTMRLRTKTRKATANEPSSPPISAKRRKSVTGLATDPTPSTTPAETTQDQPESPSSRNTQRIPMPHNSMFVMGLATNETWLHGISPDKRQSKQRSPAELAYGAMRISLTFRHIGTFLSSDSRLMWGQGATSKIQHTARSTINGVEAESQRVIHAFSNENQSTEFDWLGNYGAGFDVLHLHFSLPEREEPMLFLSAAEHDNLSIKLYLAHLSIKVQEVATTATPALEDLQDATGKPLEQQSRKPSTLCFRDVDPLHTQITGVTPILLYLDRAYARYLMSTAPAMLSQAARELEILASPLLPALRTLATEQSRSDEAALQELEELLLATADAFTPNNSRENVRAAPQATYLAGPEFGIADCAVWPLVRQILGSEGGIGEEFPVIQAWVRLVGEKADMAILATSTEAMSV